MTAAQTKVKAYFDEKIARLMKYEDSLEKNEPEGLWPAEMYNGILKHMSCFEKDNLEKLRCDILKLLGEEK